MWGRVFAFPSATRPGDIRTNYSATHLKQHFERRQHTHQTAQVVQSTSVRSGTRHGAQAFRALAAKAERPHRAAQPPLTASPHQLGSARAPVLSIHAESSDHTALLALLDSLLDGSPLVVPDELHARRCDVNLTGIALAPSYRVDTAVLREMIGDLTSARTKSTNAAGSLHVLRRGCPLHSAP